MINPIFLILSSLFILGISLFSISGEKINYKIQKEQFIKFNKLASKYAQYQQNFTNKNAIVKRIEKIISSSKISNSNIYQDKKSITVKLNNLKVNQIDKFINTILNQRFNIVKLEITTNKIIVEIGII